MTHFLFVTAPIALASHNIGKGKTVTSHPGVKDKMTTGKFCCGIHLKMFLCILYYMEKPLIILECPNEPQIWREQQSLGLFGQCNNNEWCLQLKTCIHTHIYLYYMLL